MIMTVDTTATQYPVSPDTGLAFISIPCQTREDYSDMPTVVLFKGRKHFKRVYLLGAKVAHYTNRPKVDRTVIN